MSLEQTIADLVAASNNLTGTINSKVEEIDQKVDQAVGSVPSAVSNMAFRSYYIDAANGDNANDGSKGSPWKSTEPLFDVIVPQFATSLNFMGGQTHTLDGIGYGFSGYLEIKGWNWKELGKPTLKLSSVSYNPETDSDLVYFINPRSMALYIDSVIVDLRSGYTNVDGASGFFRLGQGNVDVLSSNVDYFLGDTPFVHGYPGWCRADFNMRTGTIDATDSSPGVFLYDPKDTGDAASTSRVELQGMTFVSTTPGDQFGVLPDHSNVLSNVDLVNY